MFVLDAVEVGKDTDGSKDAELLIQTIRRTWGQEQLTVVRRGRSIRVVSPHPKVVNSVHGFLLMSPRNGADMKIHTYRRNDDQFLNVNWRPRAAHG